MELREKLFSVSQFSNKLVWAKETNANKSVARMVNVVFSYFKIFVKTQIAENKVVLQFNFTSKT